VVTEKEFEQWDDAYAAEMRRVHYEFPDDQDVMALFVEALMMRTVRRLWDLKTGRPAPNSDVPWSVRRMANTALQRSRRTCFAPRSDSTVRKKDARRFSADLVWRSTSTADDLFVSVYPWPCAYFT